MMKLWKMSAFVRLWKRRQVKETLSRVLVSALTSLSVSDKSSVGRERMGVVSESIVGS